MEIIVKRRNFYNSELLVRSLEHQYPDSTKSLSFFIEPVRNDATTWNNQVLKIGGLKESYKTLQV